MRTATDTNTYVRVSFAAHSSAALEALNANEPRLTAAIERNEHLAAARAKDMSKAELIADIIGHLDDDGTSFPTGLLETDDAERIRKDLQRKSSTEVREIYAKAASGSQKEHAELAALRSAVHADRMFCHYLNSRIRQAEEIHDEFMVEAEGGPTRAAHFMAARGKRYHRLQHGAHLAAQFGRALEAGAELRDYAEKSLRALLQQTLRYPQDVYSNGALDPEVLYRTLAAGDIIGDIQIAYGDLQTNPMTFSIGDIRF